MMGVPIEGPTNEFCDNEVVCKSTTKTEAVLIQKHHSIAYHSDRKTDATDYSCIQVRDSRDSVGPIYEDKDGNEEGELVRQVYALEEVIALLVYAYVLPKTGLTASSYVIE
jgi:hypothetical protein